MKETPGQSALAIDKSAAALGLDEFSLLSRIQAGEIKVARATSGEMVIPESELERLAGGPVSAQSVEGGAILPDECLGIERRHGGLKQNGELVLPYKVSGCRLSEGEINGYRAASSAIAGQLESIKDFKRQLTRSDQVPESCDFEINTPEIGRWEVRSALLNLNHGEILLCQRGNAFAVIERFDEDSPYAQANGNAQILLQGNDAYQLTAEFKANAGLTLEFMASNLTAKAQKIVWEQFPEHRFGRIVETISERCGQAVANEEMISQKVTHSIGRSIGV
ncbi:MAG: hypothetical protein DME22_18515 [Verrucomicrobia bacterium]|nr:MAG: hypothetical protein DME22_18515 [Verrucomicrobiota bacterium]